MVRLPARAGESDSELGDRVAVIARGVGRRPACRVALPHEAAGRHHGDAGAREIGDRRRRRHALGRRVAAPPTGRAARGACRAACRARADSPGRPRSCTRRRAPRRCSPRPRPARAPRAGRVAAPKGHRRVERGLHRRRRRARRHDVRSSRRAARRARVLRMHRRDRGMPRLRATAHGVRAGADRSGRSRTPGRPRRTSGSRRCEFARRSRARASFCARWRSCRRRRSWPTTRARRPAPARARGPGRRRRLAHGHADVRLVLAADAPRRTG